MIDCIILAGGFGSRLKRVVSDRPKPLALINNTPFLDIIIKQLLETKEISKIILAVGYKADQIINYYQNSSFEFSVEKTPLGTGGAIKKALKQTISANVLVLNGDSYLDFSFSEFFRIHRTKKADMTIAYAKQKKRARYGSIILDPDTQKILSFKEKNRKTASPFINGGVYLLKRNIFENLPFESNFSLESDAFPYLLKKKLFGYYCAGLFLDIGTEESYLKAQKTLKHLQASI